MIVDLSKSDLVTDDVINALNFSEIYDELVVKKGTKFIVKKNLNFDVFMK